MTIPDINKAPTIPVSNVLIPAMLTSPLPALISAAKSTPKLFPQKLNIEPTK